MFVLKIKIDLFWKFFEQNGPGLQSNEFFFQKALILAIEVIVIFFYTDSCAPHDNDVGSRTYYLWENKKVQVFRFMRRHRLDFQSVFLFQYRKSKMIPPT